MSKYEWMSQALCREVDPELFHPTVGQNTSGKAKKVCRQCNVTEQCLTFGLSDASMSGIFGETTEDERSRMRKLKRVSNG